MNNNAVMGEEPCWGRGLIIKQLGNLFSIIHVVLDTSGASQGCFQKTLVMPQNTKRKFKVWSSDGDAFGELVSSDGASALDELGKQNKSLCSLPGDQKGLLSA